jgi:hypothetical protein
VITCVIRMCISAAGKFNQLVYNYPIRIPERFSLVIRSLLTQEGICFTLQRDFKFLEVRIKLLVFLIYVLSNLLLSLCLSHFRSYDIL